MIISILIMSLFGRCSNENVDIVELMADKYVEICTSKGISIIDSLHKHENYLVNSGLFEDTSSATVYGIWQRLAEESDGGVLLNYSFSKEFQMELRTNGVIEEYENWLREEVINEDFYYQSDLYLIEQKVDSMKFLPDINVGMIGSIVTSILDTSDFDSKYYRLVSYGVIPLGCGNARK